jgi:hypothetical protein
MTGVGIATIEIRTGKLKFHLAKTLHAEMV